MRKDILYGIFVGFIVALAMRFIPVFHGPNSNIIKNMEFREQETNKCYSLSPYKIDCPN